MLSWRYAHLLRLQIHYWRLKFNSTNAVTSQFINYFPLQYISSYTQHGDTFYMAYIL